MGPVQTLHEFALNLLNDPQALADFNADPQGVLNAAGLGDVSEADVREIIPLVMDTAPASVTEPLSAVANGADVAGTLDEVTTDVTDGASGLLDSVSQVAAGALGNLPNLSGVFGGVSHLAEDTGLNTTAVGALDTVEDVVDGVTNALDGLPLVGPVLDAADVDLHHTVDAITEHESDGKLVGAAVDALTNHLGDALMPEALVDAVGELPAVGEPVSNLVRDVRHDGGAVLGSLNEAIGSTPVGEPSGQALADSLGQIGLNEVSGTLAGGLTDAVGGVTNAVNDLTSPVLGNAASDLVNTASNALGGAQFDAAGDVSETLDHVTAAVPAVPALPAEAPALPNASTVTDAVNSVTQHVPAAHHAVSHVAGAVADTPGVADVQQHVTTHATDAQNLVSDVVGQAAPHDLDITHVADGAEHLHDAIGGLADDLHLGH